MADHRTLLIAVAAAVVFATTVGTGAFSATATDRSIDLTVVDDDEAYLGVEQTTATTNDTTNLTVTVTNRFRTELTTVDVVLSGATADAGPLDPGETADVTFTNVSCADSLSIDATGSDVSVSLSRPVAC